MVSLSVQRVITAAGDAGLDLKVIEYPHGTRTALDAAAAVGCDVAQIVKSMIFSAGSDLVLALTSGASQVDPVKLAIAVGVGSCGRADADEVRARTGFAIGGVAPFGHLSSIQTVLDPDLLRFDQVWAAAGTPRHVFPISPIDLARLANASEADFTK